MCIKRRRCLAAFVAVTLGLTGCGDLDPFDVETSSPQPRRPPADVNAADIDFAHAMIEHLDRGQALAAAALAPQADASDGIVRLASHFAEEDLARIMKLSRFLDDWAQEVDSSAPVTSIAELVGLTGEAFDERWTALMIEHHERSVSLAEEVQRDGSYRRLDNMASGMLVDLGFEISEMSSL